MKSFNQLLVERVKSYFKKNHNLELSDETANEYLSSLAGLFAVLAESGGGKTPPDPLERSGGGDRPASDDLISPHSCK